MKTLSRDTRARRGRVDLVHLVSLVQPNKRDRPDKQERPAGPRTSLATVHRRWRIISASCQAYLSWALPRHRIPYATVPGLAISGPLPSHI